MLQHSGRHIVTQRKPQKLWIFTNIFFSFRTFAVWESLSSPLLWSMNMNESVGCWSVSGGGGGKCWHFHRTFPRSTNCWEFLQPSSLFPFFFFTLTTWFCVFSVKKDFSLYARFVELVKGWDGLELLLAPLEMIYCEKYSCWNCNIMQGIVVSRAVQSSHTLCLSVAFFMASDSVWMRNANMRSCRGEQWKRDVRFSYNNSYWMLRLVLEDYCVILLLFFLPSS